MEKNKGLIRVVAIVVVSLLIVGAIGTGYYLVQQRQTTESSADSNLCPQNGYLPLDGGGACPQGSEVVNVDVQPIDGGSETAPGGKTGDGTIGGDLLPGGDGDARGGDGGAISIQCCRPVVVELPPTSVPEIPTNTPEIPTDIPASKAPPTSVPTVPTEAPPTDVPEVPTDTPPGEPSSPGEPSEPDGPTITKGPSCPAIPKLNVTVTCLECIDATE